MTQLAAMECRCGHHAILTVADVPDPEVTVAEVVARARCAACDRAGAVKHSRIVYALKGESAARW